MTVRVGEGGKTPSVLASGKKGDRSNLPRLFQGVNTTDAGRRERKGERRAPSSLQEGEGGREKKEVSVRPNRLRRGEREERETGGPKKRTSWKAPTVGRKRTAPGSEGKLTTVFPANEKKKERRHCRPQGGGHNLIRQPGGKKKGHPLSNNNKQQRRGGRGRQ